MQNSLIDQLGIKITSDFCLTSHKEFLFFGRKEIWILKGTTVMLLWENCFLIWNFDFSGETSAPKPQTRAPHYLWAAAPTPPPSPAMQNPTERSHAPRQQTTALSHVRGDTTRPVLWVCTHSTHLEKHSSSQSWEQFCSAVTSHCRLNLCTCFSAVLTQSQFLLQPPSPAGGRQLPAGLTCSWSTAAEQQAEPQPCTAARAAGWAAFPQIQGWKGAKATLHQWNQRAPNLPACGAASLASLLWTLRYDCLWTFLGVKLLWGNLAFFKKYKIYEKSVCLWKLRCLHAHLTCSLCQCHSHQKITPGKQRSGRSLGAAGSAGWRPIQKSCSGGRWSVLLSDKMEPLSEKVKGITSQ